MADPAVRIPDAKVALSTASVYPESTATAFEIAARLGATTPGQRASAIELALEALYLAQKISKDADEAGTVYG